ncbi:GFA family protein [Jannaschia aquimarina]|uniref:Glutathione-dependent formaldehyde-activating enzyme n=1 Tax=Jannaschia aquimarina TaxID=935700 RepID=A0A0D1EEZ5_9RHOB|nr:GFA family protein [Jannaschia aquimarina]KIT14475.1 Glutathione-dependent formaldehyde-activating enzyme [Jannaschia aquimarina]SNT28854.1 Uncharacterized conserved protein [Jannaschia aquimarina]
MSAVVTGRCLCGAVRFRVSGALRPVIACHCGQCRKATGNHVAATAAPRDGVVIEGQVTWYRSSAEALRGFCGTCGANLFWDGPGSHLSIMAGALDRPTGLSVEGHIFCAGRPAWDAIDHPRQVPGADPGLTTVVTS